MNLAALKRLTRHKPARKRRGQGSASHWGKTAGRGNKGAKARTGWQARSRFEGGQTPLYRRLPKRGFNNPFRLVYAVVNLGQLEQFDAGGRVGPEELRARGLARGHSDGLAVLGAGTFTKALTVRAHRFSRSAVARIAAAGGTVEYLKRVGGVDQVTAPPPPPKPKAPKPPPTKEVKKAPAEKEGKKAPAEKEAKGGGEKGAPKEGKPKESKPKEPKPKKEASGAPAPAGEAAAKPKPKKEKPAAGQAPAPGA
ncbi:MAG: 50S ribosomal protein L15 [Planctomycetes bacterium]|nr:50S ribosomal protein L15 [Planctomycetota bacterium]